MEKFSKYVGLDTHKETIAVAVADALGGNARYYGPHLLRHRNQQKIRGRDPEAVYGLREGITDPRKRRRAI